MTEEYKPELTYFGNVISDKINKIRKQKTKKGVLSMNKKLITEISITWNIDDLREIYPKLTDEQADLILRHIKKNHDANIGINWDVISSTIDDFFLGYIY